VSYASIEDSKRTFTDEEGREWTAERIGRTSGIVSTDPTKNLPLPSDIIRFSCKSADEPDRESTVEAGALERFEEADLRSIHKKARIIQRP
jgi:hypothetical protein